MNRRGFLGAILATACAPAIVRADSLMRIVPREARVLLTSSDIQGIIRNLMPTQAEMNKAYSDMILYGIGHAKIDGMRVISFTAN